MAALMLPFTAGCGGDNLNPPAQVDQADLYWSLDLNYHAAVLSTTAPYDTLRLVATPRNFRDEPLAGLPAAQYSSRDPERVNVTADGTVIAVAAAAQPVVVVATLTAGNLKHTDSVFVTVVDNPTPPVLADFSVHPLPPDSAKISTNTDGVYVAQPLDTLPARATAAGGDSIPVYGREIDGYLPVYFRSADTTRALIHPTTGVLKGLQPGSVSIYASTNAFGVAKFDTLPYRIGLPVIGLIRLGVIGMDSVFRIYQPDVQIGLGGAVAWWGEIASEADTIDVTFDDADPSNIAATAPVLDRLATYNLDLSGFWCAFECETGGNMLLTYNTVLLARWFPVPGTYEYRSVRHGVSGRIVVVDEQQ